MADTYTIRVVDERVATPTQVSLVEKATGAKNSNPKLKKTLPNEDAKQVKILYGILGSATAIGIKTTTSYLHFTGRNSKANTVSLGAKYVGAFFGGLALGGPIGAGLAVAGIVAKDQFSYKMERVEDYAMTQYLNEQTKSRTDGSMGDYYRWKLL